MELIWDKIGTVMVLTSETRCDTISMLKTVTKIEHTKKDAQASFFVSHE